MLTLADIALGALIAIWIAFKVIKLAFKVAIVCLVLLLGGGVAAGESLDLSPIALLQKLF